MTAGDYLIIMRLNRHWTVLHVSIILAGLILTLNADGDVPQCDAELTAPQRVYEAKLGEVLEIYCLVTAFQCPLPTITWFKQEDKYVPVNISTNSHIKEKWEQFTYIKGKSILTFQNIRRNDSGTYHCDGEYTVSHGIKVSVSDGEVRPTNSSLKNDTITEENDQDQEPTKVLLLPVYFAAGLSVFVILVITVIVLSLRGCKGKPKKETQSNNQHVAVALQEQPSPRRSPPRSNLRMSQPRESEVIYSQMKVDRGRGRGGTNVEEEAGSIVYAALNHQYLPRAAVRPPRPKEESSEYAAIRVSDVSLHVGKR